MPDHGCVSLAPFGTASVPAAAPSGLCKENSEDYACAAKRAPRLVPGSAGARRGGRSHYAIAKELIVVLIAYYVAFMIAGDLAAYAIGLVTELEFGGHVSLIVFLALYFLFLWIAWILAVWLTKPKPAEPQTARSA
jgi:hypothetical protein